MQQIVHQPQQQLAIVGSQFCSPYPTQYVIQKKVLSLSGGDFTITDANGNLFFKVDGRVWSIRNKRVLLDAFSRPLISMKRKLVSMHSTWRAFLGEKELYNLKQSAIIQFRTSLDVYLAHNNTGSPDFSIKGDFLARNCLIYHNNQVVAEVRRNITVSNFVVGKDTFGVFVQPGTDGAFIISLIVAMDAIHHDGELHSIW